MHLEKVSLILHLMLQSSINQVDLITSVGKFARSNPVALADIKVVMPVLDRLQVFNQVFRHTAMTTCIHKV